MESTSRHYFLGVGDWGGRGLCLFGPDLWVRTVWPLPGETWTQVEGSGHLTLSS